MKKLSAVIVFLASITLSAAAGAAPGQVFRVDDRLPAVIFQTGFRAWGNNPNLVEHIEGSTCNLPAQGRAGVEGSSYISTSEDTQVAMNVIRVRLRQMARADIPPVVWLYTIRATPNVYSVAHTFEASGQTLGTGRLQPVYRMALALSEWVARGAIPANTIVGAQRYELVNDVPTPVANGYLSNPNFVVARTQANPGSLPRSALTDGQTTLGRLRAVIGDGAQTVMSACWCNSRPDDAATSRAVPTAAPPAAAGSACTDQINHVWPATPSVSYVPGPGFWRVDL